MRKIFDWVAGLSLIALGFVGFVLPILQGWLFVIMGLAVLSSHNRYAKLIYDRLKTMGRSVRDKVSQKRDRHRERRAERGALGGAPPPVEPPVSVSRDPSD